MKQAAYEKRVSWAFKAAGEVWQIISFTDDFVEIEETEKNGQEDTHVYAEFHRKDGAWTYEPAGKHDPLIFYRGPKTAEAIVAFLNEHGLPKE